MYVSTIIQHTFQCYTLPQIPLLTLNFLHKFITNANGNDSSSFKWSLFDHFLHNANEMNMNIIV